jgi:histidinol phosphatase-like enzyme (inositol monophosphatase family)
MTGLDREIAARLDLARRAACDAGKLTLSFFRGDAFAVEAKSDGSPVTEADRQAERELRRQIADSFPYDAILGEEYGEQSGTSEFRWIMDPIDGTKSFVRGVPLYGTLVGVEHAGDPVAGVIYIPPLDECVYAARGTGAWLTRGSGQPARAGVSKRERLADGLFLTSQVSSFARRGAAEAYSRLQRAAGVTRTWGDCYGYLLVATGRAEAMVDPIMNLWDAAAAAPIVEEAGGTFTDWSGKRTVASGEGVATNGLVLAEVLAITREYPANP